MSAAVYAVATGTSCSTHAASSSARGACAVHVGDDAVDLVAARGPVGQPREPRVVGELRLLHRAAEAREVRVRAGDDAHVLAVRGGVVVERRAVREAVALAAAHDAEPVVGRRSSTRARAATAP